MVYEHPDLHARLARRPAPAADALRRAQHRLLRRVPRLGLPRGRLRVGRARGAGAGVRLVTGTAPLRGPGDAHAPAGRARPLPVPLRRLPVAGRPRRAAAAATAAARRSAGVRSRDHLGDPDRSIRENVDVPGRARRRSGRRAGAAADQRRGRSATSSTRCRCTGATTATATSRCVVAEVHNTYGERHCYLLRAERARPRRGRQGVLRVAVPDRRRPLPDELLDRRTSGCRSRWS